jgi:hypothetical protein
MLDFIILTQKKGTGIGHGGYYDPRCLAVLVADAECTWLYLFIIFSLGAKTSPTPKSRFSPLFLQIVGSLL